METDQRQSEYQGRKVKGSVNHAGMLDNKKEEEKPKDEKAKQTKDK